MRWCRKEEGTAPRTFSALQWRCRFAIARWEISTGIDTENIRHEQRKVIKYNQLVANLVILHNVEAITRVLKELQAEGFAVDAAVLGGLTPYRVEHINRFGDYSLDLEWQVPPMQFETILI